MGKKNKTKMTLPPLKWDGSVVVWIVTLLIRLLRFLSPYTYIELGFHHYNRDVPQSFSEIWVGGLLFFQILCFSSPEWPNNFKLFVSIYVLFNIILSAANDLIENPIINKYERGEYFVEIRNPVRWLILSMVNVVQTVLSFGLMYLLYGPQFKPSIKDPTTAIYQSLLTLTTLGYGDITPICIFGKKLVILELSFFLFFLTLKLPVVLSAFKIEVK